MGITWFLEISEWGSVSAGTLAVGLPLVYRRRHLTVLLHLFEIATHCVSHIFPSFEYSQKVLEMIDQLQLLNRITLVKSVPGQNRPRNPVRVL